MGWPTAESAPQYADRLAAFTGWKVVGAAISDDGEGFVGLKLRSPDAAEEAVVWFQSDDEGNLPGSFDIQRGEVSRCPG